MSETSPRYRPSDPYQWGLQGSRPEVTDREYAEPFSAPPIPKDDDYIPDYVPDQAPPAVPEPPREWVMEGYLPMLWRELIAGIQQGKRDAQRLYTRRQSHVPEVPEQPDRPSPVGQVEEREAPEHR